MLRQRTHGIDHVTKLFAPFGVDLAARLAPHNGNPAAMAEAFNQAKADAKKCYREMAFQLHPDRGGDEEQLKEVNALWNIIKGLEARARPKPKPVAVTTVFVGVVRTGGSAATETSIDRGGRIFAEQFVGGRVKWINL